MVDAPKLGSTGRGRKRLDLALVAAGGGHLDLLIHIDRALKTETSAWIIAEGTRAESLREAGNAVYTLPDLNRTALNIRNPLRAIALALRLRPRVILTSGAGNVIAFCLAARVLGARLVFVETMARVTGPSTTGRLLSRFASKVFVQWPELLAHYRRAVLCRPILLEGIGESEVAGEGTFVSVGTHAAPMDRLLAMVDQAVDAGVLPQPVVVQAGACNYAARNFDSVRWMSHVEFAQALARARYIVGHAGAGIISGALREGRRPMLLPRESRRGEHVDDHQLQLVGKLAQLGLAVELADQITIDDVTKADGPIRPSEVVTKDPDLGSAIDAEIQEMFRVGR